MRSGHSADNGNDREGDGMSRQSMALLMAMAAACKSQGYALDVSCSPMDYARSLNHTKQQRIKRNGRKGK